VHLVFTQTNASAGRVSWSAPSETNGKLRSYRIYFSPEELAANRPLDKWAQVSSNQTTVEITDLVLASYSITVKASTQVLNTFKFCLVQNTSASIIV
jgi:Fibronectin type III domain